MQFEIIIFPLALTYDPVLKFVDVHEDNKMLLPDVVISNPICDAVTLCEPR